jgi:superfamily II DNA or RNA helicase
MFYINNTANITGNEGLREPQIEGFETIKISLENNEDQEIGVVLPVGCGKSGLITLTPFSIKAKRTLVIAPNLSIRNELYNNFYAGDEKYFYKRTNVIVSADVHPQPVELGSDRRNPRSILDDADVVITNIDQLSTEKNSIYNLPKDFFDLILVDEAHHNVAESWKQVRNHFDSAKIVNFSATPKRSDGRVMSGKIVYSYPIVKALEKNYIKDVEAWVINPETLHYQNATTQEEITMSLSQIREKAKVDSEFRKSIIMSEETINLIVDTSLQALGKIRKETGSNKHAIIASAQNYEHCLRIVEAYKSRKQRVEYIHSRDDSKLNDKILTKLKNDELDVIVQVNKLGEGFDHKYLSVAAVFKIFRSMSPFVQFIGRIMRKTQEGKEKGILVFHLGTNIASLWDDFKLFSKADQDYFETLLKDENEVSFKQGETLKKLGGYVEGSVNIIDGQSNVRLTKNLLTDPILEKILEDLHAQGYNVEDLKELEVKKHFVANQDKLESKIKGLNHKIENETGKLLAKKGVNPGGSGLDKQRLNKTNYQVVISRINKKVNEVIGKKREDFDLNDIQILEEQLHSIIEEISKEIK